MAEENEGTTPPVTPPVGETNEQKAQREAEERATNEAEKRVKGWTTEAIADYFKKNPLQAPTTPATSSPKTAAKKSLLEKVLGL